jgi:hypothetical protein
MSHPVAAAAHLASGNHGGAVVFSVGVGVVVLVSIYFLVKRRR